MLASGEYQPTAFSLDLMLKDLQIAVQATTNPLALVAGTAQCAERAIAAGHGDDDYTALAGFFAFEGSLPTPTERTGAGAPGQRRTSSTSWCVSGNAKKPEGVAVRHADAVDLNVLEVADLSRVADLGVARGR